MTTLLIAALALLAFPACCLRTATPDDQTLAQIIATIRAAAWWSPTVWVACVGIVPFLMALWCAARFALYLAARLIAAVAARVASFTSMDGRDVRLYRTNKLRELRA